MGIKYLLPGIGLYSYDVGYTFGGFKPKASILLVRCSLSDLFRADESQCKIYEVFASNSMATEVTKLP